MSDMLYMKSTSGADGSYTLTVTFALGTDPDINTVNVQNRVRGGFRPVQRLLDLSGLAWVGGDTFLAVHDPKNPEELRRVRVSLLMLPQSPEGLLWKPLWVRFPGGPSIDLEIAARIPDTEHVLGPRKGSQCPPRGALTRRR